MGIDLRGVNSLRFNSREPLKHRVGKLPVCHSLFKAGHRFKTEQLINGKQCDIIDLDTFVIYEIESQGRLGIMKKKIDDFTHPYVEDLVIVDLGKVQSDWCEFYRLSDYLRRKYNLP
ncbi:MAG: hypothetical protein QXZ70_04175 [Candidatus Bathyarchaeia archaeon]